MERPSITLLFLAFVFDISVYLSCALQSPTLLEETITNARCKARCLSEAVTQEDGALSTGLSRLTLDSCSQYQKCVQCMKPCMKPFLKASQCRSHCEANELCLGSCLFMKLLSVQRMGECPAEGTASGWDTVSLRLCHDDLQCTKDKHKTKCCYNGAGYTCQKPVLSVSIPQQPSSPIIHEQTKDGSLVVEWKEVASSLPVVYILTSRYSSGKHYKPDQVTDWKFITMTSGLSAVVKEVKSGHWYEFAVAAVITNGSRGFSKPSKPFALSEAPKAPGSPQNLSEGNSKLSRGRVSLLIHWQPPMTSDLDIVRYKVCWSKRLSRVTADLVTLKVFSKAVKGNQLSFRLKNLEPGTKYYIQVYAISQYGHSRLKSQPASMHVLTRPSSQTTQKQPPVPREIAPESPRPPLLYNISVGKIFFQDNQLQAHVKFNLSQALRKHIDKFLLHWKPEVCMGDRDLDMETKSATTHNWQFAIYGLYYDCMYVVTVHPTFNGRSGHAQHTMFYTPSCDGDPNQGREQSSCPQDAPHPLSPPIGLKYTLLVSATNVSVMVVWKPPNQNTDVLSYRLLWGLAVKQHGVPQPVMDRNTAVSIKLNHDTSSHSLLDLLPDQTYVIQIQGISVVGPGRPAFKIIKTPSQTFLDTLREVRTYPATQIREKGRGTYTSLQTETSKENLHHDQEKIPSKLSLPATSSASKISQSALVLYLLYLIKTLCVL